VQVIASNAAGPSAPARSAQSAVVAQAPQPPASIAPPTIAGEAREGQTLTTAAGEGSTAPTSYAHQWLRCDAGGATCNPFEAATASRYQVACPARRSSVRVQVIASNAAGPSAPARSAQSAVVAQAPQPPASIAPPTIAGEAREGQTLTATAGEWSGAPTSFAYQWLRCRSEERRVGQDETATASSYQVAGADVGSTLRAQVTGSLAFGPALPARSAQSAVVAQAPQPPASIAPPTIAGEAREGQTLTATAGEWSGAPTSFAYQWLRC